MRVRTGHGPEDWQDAGSAHGQPHGRGVYSGGLVVGVSSTESQRLAEKVYKARKPKVVTRQPDRSHQGKVYATEEERIAARRATWRASKARAR